MTNAKNSFLHHFAKAKFLQIILIAILLSASNLTFAQMNFESSILKSLHYFATKPNNDNIVETMKQNKIELKTEKKDRDGNRLIQFAVPNGKLEFCYSKTKKLVYVRMDLPKSNGSALANVVNELESKQFNKRITRKNAFNEDPMTIDFINKDFPYIFLIYIVLPEHNSIFIFNSEFEKLENFELS